MEGSESGVTSYVMWLMGSLRDDQLSLFHQTLNVVERALEASVDVLQGRPSIEAKRLEREATHHKEVLSPLTRYVIIIAPMVIAVGLLWMTGSYLKKLKAEKRLQAYLARHAYRKTYDASLPPSLSKMADLKGHMTMTSPTGENCCKTERETNGCTAQPTSKTKPDTETAVNHLVTDVKATTKAADDSRFASSQVCRDVGTDAIRPSALTMPRFRSKVKYRAGSPGAKQRSMSADRRASPDSKDKALPQHAASPSTDAGSPSPPSPRFADDHRLRWTGRSNRVVRSKLWTGRNFQRSSSGPLATSPGRKRTLGSLSPLRRWRKCSCLREPRGGVPQKERHARAPIANPRDRLRSAHRGSRSPRSNARCVHRRKTLVNSKSPRGRRRRLPSASVLKALRQAKEKAMRRCRSDNQRDLGGGQAKFTNGQVGRHATSRAGRLGKDAPNDQKWARDSSRPVNYKHAPNSIMPSGKEINELRQRRLVSRRCEDKSGSTLKKDRGDSKKKAKRPFKYAQETRELGLAGIGDRRSLAPFANESGSANRVNANSVVQEDNPKTKQRGKKKGKCKTCKKTWEHRTYPNLSKKDNHSSLFQKVPMTSSHDFREGEQVPTPFEGKRPDNLVLNSLAGNGAFYAYRDVRKLGGCDVDTLSKRKDANTNKSAAGSDRLDLVFGSNSFDYKADGVPHWDGFNSWTTSSEWDEGLDRSPWDSSGQSKSETIGDLFRSGWDHYPLLGSADCKVTMSEKSHGNKNRDARTRDIVQQPIQTSKAETDCRENVAFNKEKYQLVSSKYQHNKGVDFSNIFPLEESSAADTFSQRNGTHGRGGRFNNGISQVTVDERLSQLNGLVQSLTGSGGKPMQPKRLQSSCRLKSIGTKGRGSKNFDDYASPDVNFRNGCSYGDFRWSNFSPQGLKEKSEIFNFLCDPENSDDDKQFNVGKIGDKEKDHCRSKASFWNMRNSSPNPSFDIEHNLMSSMADSGEKHDDAKRNCKRISLGDAVPSLGPFFDRSPRGDDDRKFLLPRRKNYGSLKRTDMLVPRRSRTNLRHEPYRYPFQSPCCKESTSLFGVRARRKTCTCDALGRKLSQRSNMAQQLNDAINHSFQERYDMVTSGRDGEHKNKNNCSPVRKGESDCKAPLIGSQPATSDMRTGTETVAAPRFDDPTNKPSNDKGSPLRGSGENKAIVHPSAFDALNFSSNEKKKLGTSLPADSSTSKTKKGNSPDRKVQIQFTPDRTTTKANPESFFQRGQSFLHSHRGQPKINEELDDVGKSPLRSYESSHEDCSMGFWLAPRRDLTLTLTDSAMQTSPKTTEGVAVQTDITLMTPRRKWVKARSSDTKLGALRPVVGAHSGGTTALGRKKRAGKVNMKQRIKSSTLISAGDAEPCIPYKREESVCLSSKKTPEISDDITTNDVFPSEFQSDQTNRETDNVDSWDCSSPMAFNDVDKPTSPKKELVISPEPSMTTLATTTGCVSNTAPCSPTRAFNDSGSNLSYVKTPNWCNVKVEEIDRRVKRALQLRQELRRSKTFKFNQDLNSPDGLDGAKESLFHPLNQSTPKEASSLEYRGEEAARSPRSLPCTSLNDSSRFEVSTSCSLVRAPLPANVVPPIDNRDSPSFPLQESPAKTVLNLEKEEQLRLPTRPRSQSSSPSLNTRRDGSSTVESASVSGGTKAQRSRSFHFEGPSSALDDRVRQGSLGQTLQEFHLKRTGCDDKNSPPTKLSKMDCPKLITELVQTLPRVPLASFVEWFIETSNPSPGKPSASANSLTSSGSRRVKTRGSSEPRPLSTGSDWFPEGKDGESNGFERGQRTHGDKDVSVGKTRPYRSPRSVSENLRRDDSKKEELNTPRQDSFTFTVSPRWRNVKTQSSASTVSLGPLAASNKSANSLEQPMRGNSSEKTMHLDSLKQPIHLDSRERPMRLDSLKQPKHLDSRPQTTRTKYWERPTYLKSMKGPTRRSPCEQQRHLGHLGHPLRWNSSEKQTHMNCIKQPCRGNSTGKQANVNCIKQSPRDNSSGKLTNLNYLKQSWRGNSTSTGKLTHPTAWKRRTTLSPSHQTDVNALERPMQLEFREGMQRTVIALRKSSEVSGIVTKFS